MADINGNVTWTATGFSTAILTALVPEYIIVSNILGNYLRNSHVEGGRFAPARTCLINMLGAKGNRIIEEVKADGYCGYGACEIINNFFGQQMGPSMAAGRARGETWIQQDNILDDLHAAGKYNADGTPPFLVIKFCVRCDETCPIASIHLLISGGLLPVCNPLTLRAAVQMVHEHEKPSERALLRTRRCPACPPRLTRALPASRSPRGSVDPIRDREPPAGRRRPSRPAFRGDASNRQVPRRARQAQGGSGQAGQEAQRAR